jgi:formate dehydrogenase accessory protein FdhE
LRGTRGGPGDFGRRLDRANSVAAPEAAREALAFCSRVLEHQKSRAADSSVQAAAALVSSETVARRLVQSFPLLNLTAARDDVAAEVEAAVAELARPPAPSPLVESGTALVELGRDDLLRVVATWLDDSSLVEPRAALWIRVAAGPVLELAAAGIESSSKEEWAGRACPACGDVPVCSVIVEESGAFLQGSPRYLVCGRCALWWGFARATCPSCGEDDSRLVNSYSADEWSWARIDVCDTCRGYIKTFDLRAVGAVEVVPLVDDVVTLALDVWAHENGLMRPALSLAGV